MAQESNQPQDPSAISSGRTSGYRTPQFIGGNTDPATGNVISASRADTAGGAVPAPARPTTRLASVDATTPKVPSAGAALTGAAASLAVPALGADLGGRLGGGQGFSDAISGVGSDVSNFANKSTFGLLGTPAQSATSSAITTPGELSNEAFGSVSKAQPSFSIGELPSATNPLGSVIGSGFGAGLGTFAVDLATGQSLGKSTAGGVGAGLGFILGNAVLPGIGGFVGSTIGSFIGHSYKSIEHSVGSFFKHLF